MAPPDTPAACPIAEPQYAIVDSMGPPCSTRPAFTSAALTPAAASVHRKERERREARAGVQGGWAGWVLRRRGMLCPPVSRWR